MAQLDAFADASSPFGRGSPPPPEDRAVRMVRLQAKMKKLGFKTPERYYQYDLKTLTAMAKTGDAFACLQLAEQYYSENKGLEADPSYDPRIAPKAEANKYMAKAATMGIVRAGALLAVRYHEEGRTVDAHAWKLISEKFGDKPATLPDYDPTRFPTDSASVRLAQLKADALLDAMLRTPRPLFPQ